VEESPPTAPLHRAPSRRQTDRHTEPRSQGRAEQPGRMVPAYIGYSVLSLDTQNTFTRRVDRARKSNMSTMGFAEIVESERSPKRLWRPNGVQIVTV
jgi:hypothetical protein